MPMLKDAAVLRMYFCGMEKASLHDVDGVHVISLYGSWHEMGRQYGSLAECYMEDVLEYVDSRLGGDAARIAGAREIAENLYVHNPEYLLDFFAGVAETSGIGMERLKLCNAVEYVEGCFQCSAMAVWGDYSGGKLIFGRNYDAAGYKEIDRDILVTVYHPDNALAMATIGYAGEIYCVNGINGKGIFVELNNGMPSGGWDIHWEMRPATTELFDMLLHAGSLDDVDRFFGSTRSFASFIIGVADRNEARSYEWCYDGMQSGADAFPPGLMLRTNHYVNRQWTYCVPSDSESWNSITRLCNMTAQAEKFKGHIDVPTMKAIMSTSIENGGPCHGLTRYQIVAVPEDLTLHIHVPCCRKWVELKLFQESFHIFCT